MQTKFACFLFTCHALLRFTYKVSSDVLQSSLNELGDGNLNPTFNTGQYCGRPGYVPGFQDALPYNNEMQADIQTNVVVQNQLSISGVAVEYKTAFTRLNPATITSPTKAQAFSRDYTTDKETVTKF